MIVHLAPPKSLGVLGCALTGQVVLEWLVGLLAGEVAHEFEVSHEEADHQAELHQCAQLVELQTLLVGDLLEQRPLRPHVVQK